MTQANLSTLRKYAELDVVFGEIKANPNISEPGLRMRMEAGYPQMTLNEAGFKGLLQQLVADKHVLQEEGALSIHPLSKDFPGYTFSEIISKASDQKKARKDLFIRYIPIGLTCISIGVTIFFSIRNYDISRENLSLNKKNIEKDATIKSLQAQVNQLKGIK